MKAFPIPVVPFGPGSHPEADTAEYLTMPQEMQTFAMPGFQLESDPQTLAQVCGLMERLRDAMRQANSSGPEQAQVGLTGVAPEVVELVNQSLGHGEVSVMVREPALVRIQETVFAGVWRVQELSPQGGLQHDSLLAGDIPALVRRAALLGASAALTAPPMRPGIMNAPAVLNELQDRSKRHVPGRPAHVVNLSLLPMSPEDLEYLVEGLDVGPVTMLSRGYGNCRITSTRLANVWWVQYFNSMDQLILNTLEVVDVPEVALAAEEDFQDSIERLGEWLAVMKEEAA